MLTKLRLGPGRLRSAVLVAVATVSLGATTALAGNIHRAMTSDSASPAPSSQPSAGPSVAPSVAPSASAEPTPAGSPAAPVVAPTASDQAGKADNHGDCVSKTAKDHGAQAPNKHGKESHGAAVSKKAHECQAGDSGDKADSAQGQQGADAKDQEKPDAAESPEPKESEAPDAADSGSHD